MTYASSLRRQPGKDAAPAVEHLPQIITQVSHSLFSARLTFLLEKNIAHKNRATPHPPAVFRSQKFHLKFLQMALQECAKQEDKQRSTLKRVKNFFITFCIAAAVPFLLNRLNNNINFFVTFFETPF
ncbi:hypothetical protein ABHD38_14865 [Enterobacter cloacae]|uniref:hypothetical protein n=1 Tax=Enterobacter cloacae TaxID=550 RepID=UPI00254DE3B4|nr:hypothetical protein [Enterobacter cloacae]